MISLYKGRVDTGEEAVFGPEPDSFLVCVFRRLSQSYCSRAESCEGLSSAEGESALIRHFGAAEQPGRGSPEQGPVGILPPTQPQVEPHWDSALVSDKGFADARLCPQNRAR